MVIFHFFSLFSHFFHPQKNPVNPVQQSLYNMKRACTILLRPKKIKKFISMSDKGLHQFTKLFTPDFRMKHAGLCKGGGATLFAPKTKRL